MSLLTVLDDLVFNFSIKPRGQKEFAIQSNADAQRKLLHVVRYEPFAARGQKGSQE